MRFERQCANRSLTAATEKSEFKRFGDIYRLTTKNMLDVGFGLSGLKLKASECLADTESKFDMVSVCTEHNVTDYKLAPPRKGGVQFALVVVASVRETPATDAEELSRKTFMVERIELIDANEVSECQDMLEKLSYVRSTFTFEGNKRDRSAWVDSPSKPLSTAKKARHLSSAPTDTSLPEISSTP